MKVLVDTSIWSLAFRRRKGSKRIQNEQIVNELKELISEARVAIIGPIRQEILSGIADKFQFNTLKEKLKSFEDIVIRQTDYELAAEYYNTCRMKGIQGSHIDFLICAVAHNYNLLIFTEDKDFHQYLKHLDVKLHKLRKITSH